MIEIGIDVSKAKLDCLWLRDPETGKVKTKKLDNHTKGRQQLVQWLLKTIQAEPEQIRVTVEATGVYHEQLAYTLFQEGFHICVVNPARPAEFARSLGNLHKTDRRDSYILALFGHRINPDPWQPEPQEIRALKALLARLDSLEEDIQRERNRQEKASISGASERVLESLATVIELLTEEKAKLEQDIDDHIDRHPELKKHRDLLETIPAVGPVISRVMVALLHSREFRTAGALAAFLGLVPKQQASGVFKGRSRLSKTGSAKIRAKLFFPAIVAIRHNPDIRAQYERLTQNGKTKMQAIGAAMRKLVQICFGVVKHQTEYRPQLQM